jgi:hypothetical protein
VKEESKSSFFSSEEKNNTNLFAILRITILLLLSKSITSNSSPIPMYPNNFLIEVRMAFFTRPGTGFGGGEPVSSKKLHWINCKF